MEINAGAGAKGAPGPDLRLGGLAIHGCRQGEPDVAECFHGGHSREGVDFVGVQNLGDDLGGHAGGELSGMGQQVARFIERAHNLLGRVARGGAVQMQRSSRRGFAGLHGQKRVPLPTASNAVSKSFSPSFPVPVGWIRGPALPSKKKPLRKHSHFQ